MTTDTDKKQLIVDLEPEPQQEGKEVVLTDEQPRNDKGQFATKTADETKVETKEVKADDGSAFADLQAQFEELRLKEEQTRAREQTAVQQLRQREAEVVEAGEEIGRRDWQVMEGEYGTIVNAIAAAEAEAQQAASEHRQALENGDFAKASDAQRRIARAEARLVHLDDGRVVLEQRAQVMRTQPQRQQQRPVVQQQERPADPVEAEITKYTPRTQSWLRNHRECVADKKMSNRTMAAHYEATAEGYVPDSDAYFSFLDQKLGFGGDNTGKSKSSTRQAPAAPVSRNSNPGSLAGERVKLSAREVQAADDLGLSLAEYARRKAIMTKQGHYAQMSMPTE